MQTVLRLDVKLYTMPFGEAGRLLRETFDLEPSHLSPSNLRTIKQNREYALITGLVSQAHGENLQIRDIQVQWYEWTLDPAKELAK
jgi:hypothetical protein